MSNLTPKQEEERKRAIFDRMSERRRNQIIKKMGYEKWDPFQEPKDPIDIRKDKSKRTTQQLVREFLQSLPGEGVYSNAYSGGALDMALGIVNDEERIKGMYEFAVWYQDLLIREGHGD
ncbi:MAG: hypothetical protein JEZ02_00720 [Desulfatibacillum sp.]|nr:hypothetical protein [Desulfatibacillum sp.]